jgi:site-specific recombinase XerD
MEPKRNQPYSHNQLTPDDVSVDEWRKMERYRNIPKYLTPRQVECVIKAAKTERDQALLAVMYQCGLRRGEVKFLRRRDWKPTESGYGLLRVWRLKGDGITEEEHPVWPWVRKILNAYLMSRSDDLDPMFPSRHGRPLGAKAVYDVFRNIAVMVGLPEDLRHPHVLRHSIAVHHANMGTEAADVQALLGHRSINSTMKYFKVTTPRKEDLVLRSGASTLFAKVNS